MFSQITGQYLYYNNSQNVCRNNRLDMFLNKCNILSPSQVGFRASMSTNEPLLDLIEEITTTLENNKYTVGVFIAPKKAFDIVDHDK